MSTLTCPWWSMPETCTHCAAGDGEAEGRRVLVLCSACLAAGTHTGCHHDVTGEPLPQEITHGDGLYFCSKGCQRSYEALEAATNRRVSIRDESEQYTFEIIKYSKNDRTVRTAVETAMRMFRSSFAPLIMENGRDLLEMVCTAYETPDEEVDEAEGGGHNFSAFRLAVLRMGGTIITAATLRVFGSKFAEMPFVSTREGHRRAGNCKRLMKAVEDMLLGGGVNCLVVPSINELLPMWTRKFGFNKFADQEVEGIEDWIVDTDRETCTLVKKHILAPGQPQPPQQPPEAPTRRTAPLPAPSPVAAAGKQPTPAAASDTAPRGPCSIMAVHSGGITAALPRKRFRAPKLVLTRQLSESDESGQDSGSKSSGSGGRSRRQRGRGSSRGGSGKASGGGPSRRGSKSGGDRKRSSRSESESDFMPDKDDKENVSDDSGADEDLVPEESLETSGRTTKKRGKAPAASAAAPSVSVGNDAGAATGASRQEDAVAKPPKPKRTRRVGPRIQRGPPPLLPPSMPPPLHPIFTSGVTSIKMPTELPLAPPPMPRELDEGRPPLSSEPFELSMHLQAGVIERLKREARMAAMEAGLPPPTATATAAPAAVPSAAAITGAAVPLPTTGAAALNAAGPQLPPRPSKPSKQPQPQPQPQPQQQKSGPRLAKRRWPTQQGKEARAHRGPSKPRTPEQEAARQRRRRLRVVARQRRREYREMMMGFVVAETLRNALLGEGPRPLASYPLGDMNGHGSYVDTDISSQRVQSELEELRSANRQLASQLAQAQTALRAAQEQVQLLSSSSRPLLQQPSAQTATDIIISPLSTWSSPHVSTHTLAAGGASPPSTQGLSLWPAPREMPKLPNALAALAAVTQGHAASSSVDVNPHDEPLAPTPAPGSRPLGEDASPAAAATAEGILTPATVYASRPPHASPCRPPYALPNEIRRHEPCLDLHGGVHRELSFSPMNMIAAAAVSAPSCVVGSVTAAAGDDAGCGGAADGIRVGVDAMMKDVQTLSGAGGNDGGGGGLSQQPDMFGSPLELQPSLRLGDCVAFACLKHASSNLTGTCCATNEAADKLGVSGCVAEGVHTEVTGSGARPRFEDVMGSNRNSSRSNSNTPPRKHRAPLVLFNPFEMCKNLQSLHSSPLSGQKSPSPADAAAPVGRSLSPISALRGLGSSGGGEEKSPSSCGVRSPLSFLRGGTSSMLSIMAQRLAEDTPRPRRPAFGSPGRGSPLKLPSCPVSVQPQSQPQQQPSGSAVICNGVSEGGEGDVASVTSWLLSSAAGVSPNISDDTQSTKGGIATQSAATDRTGCGNTTLATAAAASLPYISTAPASGSIGTAACDAGVSAGLATCSVAGVNGQGALSIGGSWSTAAGMAASPSGDADSIMMEATMPYASEQPMFVLDTGSVLSPAAVRHAFGAVTEVARPPRPPMQSPPATSRSPGSVAGAHQGYVAAMLLAAHNQALPGSPAGSVAVPAGTNPDAPAADGRVAVSDGLLGDAFGPRNRSSGSSSRGTVASPESLRRFETQCLMPLLPCVVSVLLADTPPSRSPNRRRTPFDRLQVEGVAAFVPQQQGAGPGAVSDEVNGAVRALLFDAVMDEVQQSAEHASSCPKMATVKPTSLLVPATALVGSESATAVAHSGTIPALSEARPDSRDVAVALQHEEETEEPQGAGLDMPSFEAVLGASRGAREADGDDNSRRAKRPRIAGGIAGGSQSDSDGGRDCGPGAHNGAASPRNASQECCPGVSTAFATKRQLPVVRPDMEHNVTPARGAAVGVLAGSTGRDVSPVLAAKSAVLLAVYDSPAPGPMKRGRLFALTAGSADVARPAPIDPYDAVLCDVNLVNGVVAADPTGGGGAPGSEANRSPASQAVSTDSSPDKPEMAAVRRRRAAKRLYGRKKTAVDLFGEDVVLTGSAQSDSPGSTPPSSAPPTLEDGRSAGGLMAGPSTAAVAGGASNVAPSTKVAAAKSLLLPLAAATGAGVQAGPVVDSEVISLRVQTAGRFQSAVPSVSSILEMRGLGNSLFGQREAGPEALDSTTRMDIASDATDVGTNRGLLWDGVGAGASEGVWLVNTRAASVGGADGNVGRSATTPRPVRTQRNGGAVGADNGCGANSPLNDGDCAGLLGAGGSASPLSGSASAYLDEPLRSLFQNISADMAANQYGKELSASALFEEGQGPGGDGGEAEGPVAATASVHEEPQPQPQPQPRPSPQPLRLSEQVLSALVDVAGPLGEVGCLVAAVASESAVYENVGEALEGVASLVDILAED